MNKVLMSIGLACAASAGFATVDASYEAMPVEMSSGSNDATGALVLLAIVGVIIATSTMAGRAKAEKDPYLMPTEEDES